MAKKHTTRHEAETLRLIPLRRAAEQLGVSPWTLRRWTRQGRVTSVRLSNRLFIPESELRAVIQRNLRPATAADSMRI